MHAKGQFAYFGPWPNAVLAQVGLTTAASPALIFVALVGTRMANAVGLVGTAADVN